MFKILLFVLSITLSAPVYGQDADVPVGLKIAVVDVQQLMNDSKAAKSIQSQGKDLMKKYQSRISKIESDLKESEKAVIKASKGESREDFMKEREKFQEDVSESQKQLSDLTKKRDQAVTDALNSLRDEIVDIVGEMTEENGYDLVITRADIITVSKDIDITSAVMKELNKSLPSIKVKD